jgi:hypothetical protein
MIFKLEINPRLGSTDRISLQSCGTCCSAPHVQSYLQAVHGVNLDLNLFDLKKNKFARDGYVTVILDHRPFNGKGQIWPATQPFGALLAYARHVSRDA